MTFYSFAKIQTYTNFTGLGFFIYFFYLLYILGLEGVSFCSFPFYRHSSCDFCSDEISVKVFDTP